MYKSKSMYKITNHPLLINIFTTLNRIGAVGVRLVTVTNPIDTHQGPNLRHAQDVNEGVGSNGLRENRRMIILATMRRDGQQE